MWTPPSEPGRVVLLNGASSSGKSTIAAELLRILPTPWFHIGVDSIGALRAEERTHELGERDLARVLARTRAGFHRVVAGMAAAGNDVVADHVLSAPWRLYDCLRVLADLDVVFVGVRCDPAELQRRERVRGDRPLGAALGHAAQVHAHDLYDLECDTTDTNAATCAHDIADFLATGRPATAFARLRHRLLDGPLTGPRPRHDGPGAQEVGPPSP